MMTECKIHGKEKLATRKSGRVECIICARIRSKKWIEKTNYDKTKAHKEWRANNKEKYKENYTNYNILNREKIKKYCKDHHKEKRMIVLNHYGLSCKCCNESNIEFLCIDHIYGGGNEHRREINGNLYKWIIKNNFPDFFRTLCHNCNHSLGAYGYCPHEKEIKKNSEQAAQS